MRIELVYEKTCPNVDAARSQLLQACTEAGIPPRWQEWEVNTPGAPAHVHNCGSPTILVNGQDCSGSMLECNDNCCRVYSYGKGNKGVPAVPDIVQALLAAQLTSDSGEPHHVNTFAKDQ